MDTVEAYVGLDVHKDTISVAIADDRLAAAVRRQRLTAMAGLHRLRHDDRFGFRRRFDRLFRRCFEERLLIGMNAVGPRAVEPLEQLMKLVFELFLPMPQLAVAGQQLVDHAVTQRQVVGQLRLARHYVWHLRNVGATYR